MQEAAAECEPAQEAAAECKPAQEAAAECEPTQELEADNLNKFSHFLAKDQTKNNF